MIMQIVVHDVTCSTITLQWLATPTLIFAMLYWNTIRWALINQRQYNILKIHFMKQCCKVL